MTKGFRTVACPDCKAVFAAVNLDHDDEVAQAEHFTYASEGYIVQDTDNAAFGKCNCIRRAATELPPSLKKVYG